MTRIPFFHYTFLDSLDKILTDKQIRSRYCLDSSRQDFVDISIDPEQPVRTKKGLNNYVPLFAGFYARFRSYELNGYLMNNYDDPKVQNPSFYGSLNETLRQKLGNQYEKVIILLVNDERIYEFADGGKIRLFSNIAVKPDSIEYPIKNRKQMIKKMESCMSGGNIYCEADLMDNCKRAINFPEDIEVMIADNDNIRKKIFQKLKDNLSPMALSKIPLFVSELPRGKVSDDLE